MIRSGLEGIRINNAVYKESGGAVTVDVEWEVGYIPFYGNQFVSWTYNLHAYINGVAHQFAFQAALPVKGLYKTSRRVDLDGAAITSVRVILEASCEPGTGYFSYYDAKPIVESTPTPTPTPTPDDDTSPVPDDGSTPVPAVTSTSWLISAVAITLLILAFSGKK